MFYTSKSLVFYISYLFTKSSKKQNLISFAEIVKEPKLIINIINSHLIDLLYLMEQDEEQFLENH